MSNSCSSAPCNFPKEKDSIMTFLLGILLNYSEQLFSSTTVNSAVIYLLKFNSGNTRAMCEVCSRVTLKKTRTTSSLLLTFNRFHTWFWSFNRWLWTNKCRLGMADSVKLRFIVSVTKPMKNIEWGILRPLRM